MMFTIVNDHLDQAQSFRSKPGRPILALGNLWATHGLLCTSLSSRTMDGGYRQCDQALTL